MTEQVKLESICPSCGKTDKLLWPDGCKNTWHIEGCGTMSEQVNVPDDLKQKCPLCAGEGNREQRNFCSAGEMDAGVEPQTHAVGCYLCKGSGFTWTLDQQEMAERIAELRAENAELVRKHNEQFKAAAQLAEVVVKLNAENARLSAPVTDAVMEELAAMEHERWSSQAIAALTDMTDARRERWTRQARLLYVGLTEAEKEQDRQQVRKTLTILAARKGAA